MNPMRNLDHARSEYLLERDGFYGREG
jgi:hypothetical protein